MRGLSIESFREQTDSRDLAVLESLEVFRLLTTGHLQRLHFAHHMSDRAAARACTRTMCRLRDLGLVSALARRVGGVRRGSASYVWQLAAAGERLLRAGRAKSGRRRFVEPGSTFVKHTLAVNDVAVAILEAGQRDRNVLVEKLSTEPQNWRTYLGSGGETTWLKPDLHVVLLLPDEDHPGGLVEMHEFLEIDLGTEHVPRIRAKCRAYAAFAASGTYQAEHGVFPAIVWLSDDPGRCAALEQAVADTPGLPPEAFRVSSPAAYIAALEDSI